jgi:hypothetical protein
MAIDKNLLQQIKQAMHVLKSAEGPAERSPFELYDQQMATMRAANPAPLVRSLNANIAGLAGNPVSSSADMLSGMARGAAMQGALQKATNKFNRLLPPPPPPQVKN